jgi:hypothetical protein
MEALIAEAGRVAAPRTTLYAPADPDRLARAHAAAPLSPVIQTPPAKGRKRTLELQS